MSLHRACCPCGTCYCGTLCVSCLAPCPGATQPAATVCISNREWDANIGDVTSGSGAGWVIWVDGAYYFFDGIASDCTTTRATEVDWELSYKADGCPDFTADVTITIPFVGGWDFSQTVTFGVNATGVNDPTACADVLYAPTDATNATQPTLSAWSLGAESAGPTAVQLYYGGGTWSYTRGGGMADGCVLDFVGTSSASLDCGGGTAFASATFITPELGAAELPTPGELNADAIRFTHECASGTYAFALSVDADGFFVCTVNTTCTIRFIGPVGKFVRAFNAIFAGTGVTASTLDDTWFLGSKVRGPYVGTVDQPTFPYSAFSPSSFTLLATGNTQDVNLGDPGYGVLDTHGYGSDDYYQMVVAVGLYGKSTVTLSGIGDVELCATCDILDTSMGNYTGYVATHPTQETGSSLITGIIRERYGVSLAPSSWTWIQALTGFVDPADSACHLTGLSFTVT